jgi:hypothetical protein
MNTLLAALILSAIPATAFAVFDVVPLPEPGAFELVALGGVVAIVVRLIRRKK